MKTRFLTIRAALLLAAAVPLLALSACSTAQTRNPGPHQDNGVPDGKDGSYRTMGAPGATSGQQGDVTESVVGNVNHVQIQLHNPGPHQISITAQDPVNEGDPAASKVRQNGPVTVHIGLGRDPGSHHHIKVNCHPKADQ